MHVLNGYCALPFPKGVLLKDKYEILIQQTENSQTARQIRFKQLDEIEVEKSGTKALLKSTVDFEIPKELDNKFNDSPNFKKTFYALTPGRQRGSILHFF